MCTWYFLKENKIEVENLEGKEKSNMAAAVSQEITQNCVQSLSTCFVRSDQELLAIISYCHVIMYDTFCSSWLLLNFFCKSQ